MASYTAAVKYDMPLSRFQLAMWFACSARPYAMVDDPKFTDFVSSLNHLATLPSRQTISRNVIHIHSLAKVELTAMLAKVQGRFHVVVDGWTLPNTISFLGVVVQYVDGGKIRMRYLDYVWCVHLFTVYYTYSHIS